jgi:hypothetical protein
MSTLEIPPAEWPRFFDSFSRRHDGWLVSVEILSTSVGDQIQVTNLPLRGISVGRKGPNSITLAFVDQADRHLSHEITSPEHVWLKQSDEGADEALEITGPAGAVLVTFRAAMPTDCVDGV